MNEGRQAPAFIRSIKFERHRLLHHQLSRQLFSISY